jgi:hypothetical protein
MQPARIPNERQHELFRLNCVSLAFKNFFALWQPDEFMTGTHVEP